MAILEIVISLTNGRELAISVRELRREKRWGDERGEGDEGLPVGRDGPRTDFGVLIAQEMKCFHRTILAVTILFKPVQAFFLPFNAHQDMAKTRVDHFA